LNTSECFIVKDGVEVHAELEDILPLLDDHNIQYLCRNCPKTIDLAVAIAYMN